MERRGDGSHDCRNQRATPCAPPATNVGPRNTWAGPPHRHRRWPACRRLSRKPPRLQWRFSRKAQELLSRVQLRDVRPCSISAVLEQAVAPSTHVASVEMDLAMSFAADAGIYGNRFDYSFVLKGDDEDEVLGTIEFSLVLDYEVDEDYVPDVEAADFVTSTTGYFAAYPYARELFQSLASRLQFDPVVLGLIKRGTLRPGTVSVAPRKAIEA